ncbi:MAG: family 43 glycosylhydrolase [Candidatus Krumholzibacteria bacterium]|nr:family 43 glycosylhydrolase [Candidatus Krumholzibacteria bacterium]
MPSKGRESITAIIAALFMLAVVGCQDTPRRSSQASCCGAGNEPTFIASKADDDDGDGNPRDEDFPRINDEDDDIADHAWAVDASGVYHLFFHNEGLGQPNEIEHYTSTDLQTFDYVGVALRPQPSGWDAGGLWAPSITEHEGRYYMFYTGVESGGGDDARQRIGLATSTDLVAWTRYPVNNCPGTPGDGCVYECAESWTTWGGPDGSFNHQCRDPFVIWDAVNGRFVLFATAKSTNQFGVVTVAYSSDLQGWSGAGYIDATRRLATGVGAQTTGGHSENPHVVSYRGTHYLLFCDWGDPEDYATAENPRTITQYATSPSLMADSSGSMQWTYRGYIPDPGVNAIEVLRVNEGFWLMSQSISNERSGNHPAHRRELRLKCLTWRDGLTFSTSNARPPCNATATGTSPLAGKAFP